MRFMIIAQACGILVSCLSLYRFLSYLCIIGDGHILTAIFLDEGLLEGDDHIRIFSCLIFRTQRIGGLSFCNHLIPNRDRDRMLHILLDGQTILHRIDDIEYCRVFFISKVAVIIIRHLCLYLILYMISYLHRAVARSYDVLIDGYLFILRCGLDIIDPMCALLSIVLIVVGRRNSDQERSAAHITARCLGLHYKIISQ